MELVDTRDLKSLASVSMRVRFPPVLPSNFEKNPVESKIQVDNLEVMVYNSKGKLINIRNLWNKSRWHTGYSVPPFGDIAQLGEHLLCTQKVKGSNPFISTHHFPAQQKPSVTPEME